MNCVVEQYRRIRCNRVGFKIQPYSISHSRKPIYRCRHAISWGALNKLSLSMILITYEFFSPTYPLATTMH